MFVWSRGCIRVSSTCDKLHRRNRALTAMVRAFERESMANTVHPPIPILRSFNEVATRDFYVGFLGFEVEFEHRFDPDAPLYLSVRLGDCVVHLFEHYGDATPGAGLRIRVEDVHAFARQLNEKRYKFARPGV